MSVYRELFVEVPLGLLEAAVIEAQARAAHPAPLMERLQHSQAGVLRRLLPTVMERAYGWTHAQANRLMHIDEIELSGRASCGHAQRVRISERVAYLAPTSVGDAIAAAVHTQRGCFCLERP